MNDNVNNNTPNATNEVPTVIDPQTIPSASNEQVQPLPEMTTIEQTLENAPTVEDPTMVQVTETKNVETTPGGSLSPTVDMGVSTQESVVGEKQEEVFENRMVNPGNIGTISTGNTSQPDPNAMVNENLKKVEVNYTPPSKGKTVLLILFFIFLIVFIIFLPEITTMVNKLKAGNQADDNVKITDGKLICTYSTNTANLDKDYKLVFGFTDNKLESLDYNVTTKGDPTLDSDTLDELANQCGDLKEYTKDINGVIVNCDYSEGKLVERQAFTYTNIDEEKITAAFTEAGGTNPQYRAGQDMDAIEKNMNASDYTCKREK